MTAGTVCRATAEAWISIPAGRLTYNFGCVNILHPKVWS